MNARRFTGRRLNYTQVKERRFQTKPLHYSLSLSSHAKQLFAVDGDAMQRREIHLTLTTKNVTPIKSSGSLAKSKSNSGTE